MRNFTYFLLFVVLIFPMYGDKIESSLSFKHVTKDHGLSNNLVFSIFQDSHGFIWIGTSDGLNRYDGYNFKQFHHDNEDMESLPHNVVTSICEDKNNAIWIATYGGGISKFDFKKNKFKNYLSFSELKKGTSIKIINHIFPDSRGTLWISSKNEGLIRFNPDSNRFTEYKTNSSATGSISSNKIMSVFEDSNGNIWIATWGSGLCRYREDDDSFYRVFQKGTSPPFPEFVHTVIEDPDKNLWLGTKNKGLVKYIRSSGKFKSYGMEKERYVNLIDKKVNTIFHDPNNDNLIWIGTENGLYIYKISENILLPCKKSDNNSGLSNNFVWSIIRDKSGLLWIGTVGGGVNIERRGVECFKKIGKFGKQIFSISSNKIGAIYSDANNPAILWVGTLGGGLNKVDFLSGKTKILNPDNRKSNSLVEKNITSIIGTKSDPEILYIGTNSGLSKYNIKTNRFSRLKSPLKKHKKFNTAFISTLMVSKLNENSLWIGSLGNGLYRLNISNYDLSNYLFQNNDKHNPELNRIYTVKQSLLDPGVLWLGTNNGIAKFTVKTKKFEFFNPSEKEDSTIRTTILSLHQSEQNHKIIWAGTRRKGLVRFDLSKKNFTFKTTKNGLPDNGVLSIVEEPKGYLWLGTLNGLSRYSTKTGIFRNFNTYEGMLNSDYNLNASHISSNKILFFGGSEGIDFFSSENLCTNMFVPPVVLTGLRIFGSSDLPGMDKILQNDISGTEEIILPHNYNTINISFAALDFTSPSQNQFSCFLDGFDKSWIYLGTKNQVTYNNLKSGKYVFHVKGSNSDSIWNEKDRKLIIIIKKNFTKSIWFLLTSVLTASVIMLLIFYFYNKPRKTFNGKRVGVESLHQNKIITEREKEIIILILKGKSNKEIEEELFISLGTVKNHLYNIYKKLKVKSRTQLISILRSE